MLTLGVSCWEFKSLRSEADDNSSLPRSVSWKQKFWLRDCCEFNFRRNKMNIFIGKKTDFEKKSKEPGLSEDYIDENADFVNWDSICEHQILSEFFIKKHWNRVNWKLICRHQKLSEEFMSCHSNVIVWEEVFQFQKVSEEFLQNCIKESVRIDWRLISIHQKLSEEFMHEYRFLLEWGHLSKNQKLSEKLIEEHKDMVRWYEIFIYQDISVEFKKKNREFLDNMIQILHERIRSLSGYY